MALARKNPKRLLLLGTIGCLLLSAVGLFLWRGIEQRQQLSQRVWRIGWEVDPPEQVRGPDGRPTGLAVELVSEAARRRGIHLAWIFSPESSEPALRDSHVDLWPLITITPEREKAFHISSPYLESAFCFLVPGSSPAQKLQDLAAARIGSSTSRFSRALLLRELPHADVVVRRQQELVPAVCRGEIDAAFIETQALISSFLATGGCGGEPFRTIPAGDARLQLGVGSTRAAAAAADAVRDEIDRMSAEGLVHPMMARWGYLAGRSEASIHDLLGVRQRENTLIAAAAIFALLLVFAALQWRRARLEGSKLRSLFSNTPDAVFLTKEDGAIEAANPAACRLLDMTEEEILRAGRSGVVDNEDPRLNPALDERRTTGKVQTELRMKRKDGSKVDVEASSAVVEARAEAFVIARDITERKANEARLRESEERFSTIFRVAPVIMTLSDLETGRFIEINDECLRSTGYRREELIGRSASETAWLSGQDRAGILAEIREKNGIRGKEIRLRDKEGRVHECLFTAEIIQIGAERRLLAISQDITDLRHSEAERQRLQSELLQSRKMESVGRLAGGIAHDFNNLLTVINGYSQLALDELPPRDPLRSRLEAVIKAGNSAAGLTRQLLAFSRRQVMQPCTIDLNRVLADLRMILERLTGEDVTVEWSLAPREIFVFADPHQIGQVLLNLAVNAREAMPRGGHLRIATEGVREAGDDCAVLLVGDNGTGMDDATREQIFEPFFTTKEQGTGLGLSTVHGIVAQSGGRIEVATEPGRGTTFRVLLPLAPGRSGSAEAPATGHNELFGRDRILLVEDQMAVRQYVAAALRTYGYQVIEATGPEEALRAFEEQKASIDIVVTDIVMPGGSGIDLGARLSEIAAGVPVLYMSGFASESSTLADKFIQKPFRPDDLARKVRSLLDR